LPAIDGAELAQIAAQLSACVREAGSLALSMFGGPVRNWTKAESSPVSEADIAADRLLRERLTAIDPQIAWLSEESVDDPARLSARRVWIVDPIDGTRAFLDEHPDWAVSAALVDNGRPIVACLYAPVTKHFFMATVGSGATCNGDTITATDGTSLAQSRIAGPKRFLERLAAVSPPFTVMPRLHSLALRFARVAKGELDAAIAGGNSHDWDLAAADLLVHEAGGALGPVGGGVITYNLPVPRHGMLVAAGRERHATLIELIRDERLTPS